MATIHHNYSCATTFTFNFQASSQAGVVLFHTAPFNALNGLSWSSPAKSWTQVHQGPEGLINYTGANQTKQPTESQAYSNLQIILDNAMQFLSVIL